jgi:hypothetical protein
MKRMTYRLQIFAIAATFILAPAIQAWDQGEACGGKIPFGGDQLCRRPNGHSRRDSCRKAMIPSQSRGEPSRGPIESVARPFACSLIHAAALRRCKNSEILQLPRRYEEREGSHSCHGPVRSVPPRGSGWVLLQSLKPRSHEVSTIAR